MLKIVCCFVGYRAHQRELLPKLDQDSAWDLHIFEHLVGDTAELVDGGEPVLVHNPVDDGLHLLGAAAEVMPDFDEKILG